MEVSMRRLFALLAVGSVAGFWSVPIASAGSVEDYALPHLTTINLAQHSSGTGFFRLSYDSVSFYLEGTTKALAAGYDTTSATDTLGEVKLQDVAPFHLTPNSAVALANDSLWYGRLTLNFSAPLASTDTIYALQDVTPDGINWLSQTRTTANIVCAAGTSQIQLRQSGQWTPTQSTGGAATVTFDVIALPPCGTAGAAMGVAAPTGVNNRGQYFGAEAIRFRVGIGTSSPVKKVNRATFTYFSNSPDAGR